jgi:MFS transporter, SHS family, sialic acid transporter
MIQKPTTADLSAPGRWCALVAAFAGLLFAGVQLGLMPVASLSVSHSLMGSDFSQGAAGDWFGRYTASLMLGAALGGVVLGALGDRIGRARAMGVSIICYSLFAAAGAAATSQEQMLLWRFLVGVGVGGMWPNGVALVSECWARTSRTMVAAILGAAINVGILTLSQVCRYKSVTPDAWRWLLQWSIAPGVLGVLALCVVPESPHWIAIKKSRADVLLRHTVWDLFRPPLLHRTLAGIALGSIALIGAWAASKWMIPWADQVGGPARADYKAATQGAWAVGAVLGSFCGAPLASTLGRRLTYFLISLGAALLTCGIFLFSAPLRAEFLPLVFAQGFVSTLYFGFLPLYLPELFPTQFRAGGTGIAYNVGRIATAGGVLGTGTLTAWFGGNYAKAGAITGLVYALGMIVIWLAPDTSSDSVQ